MKAWQVREIDNPYTTVVFAETRGKAKALALATDACEYAEFINIEVHRRTQLDKYYKVGKREMDWYDPKDRIALVKELGMSCEYMEDCEKCSAKKYCEQYQHYLESESDTE